LSQESLCLLRTSLLASAVFLMYTSLSSSFFEFSLFCMIFSLFLLIVLFGHPIFLNSSPYFVSLLFLDFHLLLILMFCKFSHSFSMSISFSFVFFKCSFTLWVYSHLMLSSFNTLTLKILPALMGPFCCPCLTIMVENLLLHIIGNDHYLFNCICKL